MGAKIHFFPITSNLFGRISHYFVEETIIMAVKMRPDWIPSRRAEKKESDCMKVQTGETAIWLAGTP
jgi:hypothetical protein